MLSEKNKNHYGSCKKDICNEFNGKPIESLRADSTPLFSSPNYITRKVRVRNSGANIAKPGAFRVIASVNKNSEEIIFMYVYPKRGPEKQENPDKEFYKELIRELSKEKQENCLKRIDLSDNLKEIE